MIRTVSFIQRRPDKTRREFRDYYESNHAPLGASYMKDGLQHYIRNHVLEDRGPHLAGGEQLPFDVISEFEYRAQADLEAIQQILASESGKRIREDELNFQNPSNTWYFGTERSTIAGSRPTPGTAPKAIAVMRSSDPTASRDALAARAREIARELVSGGLATAAELDVGRSDDTMGVPAWEVVLHTWWPDGTGATAALDALESMLAPIPQHACAWVDECGSLDFDYAQAYPER